MPAPLTRAEVVGVCGDILDWKIKAIIESGATLSELETAAAWAAGTDDATAAVYDILTADEELDEEA